MNFRNVLIGCWIMIMTIYAKKALAQTDGDAIMMNKKLLCIGGMYSYSSWDNYWEGTFKRNNENLGTVSTKMIGVMGSYGINKNLNFLFSLPYVTTRATAGTLKGLHGFQDLSLFLKWRAFAIPLNEKSILSVYGVGGYSFPVSDYPADFLPLSIGIRSKNLTMRAMVDYQYSKFFATASGAYMVRSNIEIDRDSYYDTQLRHTNIVDIPNAAGFNFRMGYRSKSLVAEGVLDNMTTLGGFDIRKNDMPFPSNKMNATTAGVAFKYSFLKKLRGLEIIGGARYTIAGRNVGQSTMFNGGAFYILDFNKKTPKS